MLAAATALVLTIRLYAPVAIAPEERRVLQHDASAILGAAGIETVWLDCSRQGVPVGPCALPMQSTEVALRILNVRGDAEPPLGQSLIDTTAPSSLATLFANRIFAAADAAGVSRGVLFARAAAHEIAHLIFGDSRHARVGVMQDTWTPAILRTPDTAWAFSGSEASRLRDRLAERAALPGAHHAN